MRSPDTTRPHRTAGRRAATPAIAALALGAALAACADAPPGPTAPNDAVSPAAVPGDGGVSPAAQLAADAVTRLLPALERDAAAPLGNALRGLHARLTGAQSTLAAQDRSLDVVEEVLAQFADPARPDAADLDAVRLAVAEIGGLLRQ